MTPANHERRIWRVLAIIRTVIAIVALLVPTATLAWVLVEEGKLPGLRDAALLLFFATAIYGLARRRPWGRWVGLGLAIAGLTTGVAAGGLTLFIMGPYGVVLLLCLLGPSMARRYELAIDTGGPWQATTWRALLLNWAVILGVAAVPALALWSAPGDTRSTVNISAALAALLLAAAAVLVARQRAAGLIALVIGGLLTVIAIWEGFGGLTDYFNACSGHSADDVARIFAVGASPGVVASAIALPFTVKALQRR